MTGPALVAAVSTVVMLVAWVVQRATRNAGVVDVCWSLGMAGAGAYYACIGTAPGWLRVALAVLVLGWFCRLGVHILERVVREPEDGRYRAMREWLGPRADVGFLIFFLLQGGLVVLLSLPFLAVAYNPQPSLPAVAAGLMVALVAFAGEVSADRQLKRFRADPAHAGLTCRQGWWRFSRHPNYFFEWLHWFAYPLLGLGSPYQAWLWLAPVVMLLFLVFLTGIPFTERQALRTRGADYRDYQRRTSMFFPWPPSQGV